MPETSVIAVVCTSCAHRIELHAENGCMDTFMLTRCGCLVRESVLRAELTRIITNA